MAELVLEVGCEELPASFVERAVQDLARAISERLTEARLTFNSARTMATPRRLIVGIDNLQTRQADESKEVRGPALKAAYDANGQPTKALEGFCRSQGVDPSTARVEGDYVYVTKLVAGRDTAELLGEILPESIRSLNFDKTMRWGSLRLRFARPIRWILAAYDQQPVAFALENLESGITSRGHRFECPEPFTATGFDELVRELRSRKVEPDPDRRRQVILEGLEARVGTQTLDPALVDENVFLTEWPMPMLGDFDPSFLDLPEPVLITVMAKHEKFFPVRTNGKLQAQFISIRNGGEEATVRAGNQWVLANRFRDAKFFFDEDRKRKLDDFLAATESMTFQEKLGSVRRRAERLATLARQLAEVHGADPELAEEAGRYAKADLSTGLVGELASLQGEIGGEYARRAGMHPDVAHAIATHYSPTRNLPPQNQAQRIGLIVTAADQLDKLAGYLGLGFIPSGTSDPFALRRAVGLLVEIGLEGFPALDLEWAIRGAVAAYAMDFDADAVSSTLADLLEQRYQTQLAEIRHDRLAALTHASDGLRFRPADLRRRAQELEQLAADSAFIQSMTRAGNIVAAAERKGLSGFSRNDSALDSKEGTALADALQSVEPTTEGLRILQDPINRFFEATMVMVDHEPTRNARLALLTDVAQRIGRFADFNRIEITG